MRALSVDRIPLVSLLLTPLCVQLVDPVPDRLELLFEGARLVPQIGCLCLG